MTPDVLALWKGTSFHTHERTLTLEHPDSLALHPDSCSLQDTHSSPEDFLWLVILSTVHVSLNFRVLSDLLFWGDKLTCLWLGVLNGACPLLYRRAPGDGRAQGCGRTNSSLWAEDLNNSPIPSWFSMSPRATWAIPLGLAVLTCNAPSLRSFPD